MRTVIFKAILVVAGLLLMSNRLSAQDAGANHDADHQALRGLMSNVTQAINKGDLEKLTRCLAKEFVFTTVDQTVLTNAASVKAFYDSMVTKKGSPISSYKMTPTADILTRFVDANTGYCYGKSDDEYTVRRNGRHVTMQSRWTALVVKEDGQWKVATVHTGMNFLENPVLEAKTMSLWRKVLLALGIGKYPGEK